jgi:hypothetical protein
MVDSGASDNYVSQRLVPSVDAITKFEDALRKRQRKRNSHPRQVCLTGHFDNFHVTSNAQVFDRKFDIKLWPGSGGYNQLQIGKTITGPSQKPSKSIS